MKIGRNDPCSCGSGKKYKKCHLPLEENDQARLAEIEEIEFQEWFKKDLAVGAANIAAVNDANALVKEGILEKPSE